jgi:DNA-binding NarL/FixJ family response regulator
MDEHGATARDGPVRVLLADGQPALRAGVRGLVEDDGFVVCAEAGDATAAVDAAQREQPDLCVVEVQLAGDGIGATRRILEAAPESTVVMLTESDADDDLFAALAAGASGYLLKDMDPGRLPVALRGALEGEAPLPRTLVSRLVRHYRERDRRRVDLEAGGSTVELTSRQWEVLELLAEDCATETIAERLAVSPVTVRRHVSRLLKTLGVATREEAVALLDDAR